MNAAHRSRATVPVKRQREALSQAGYKCINPKCPHHYPERTLNIHHIREDGDNDLENLAVLCEQCHADTHYFGSFSGRTLTEWKAQAASQPKSNVAVEAREALRFAIPRLKSQRDTSTRIAQLCGRLLASGPQSASPLVQTLLRFELAKSLHRVGASGLAARMMREILLAQDQANELLDIGFGETTLLELRHSFARESLQLGLHSAASEQMYELIPIARESGFYRRGMQSTQLRVETLAQISVDILHAALSSGLASIDTALDAATDAVVALARQSRRSTSIFSQYLLYKGLKNSRAGDLKTAARLITESLNSKADQSLRGQSIRLSMLATVYLRSHIHRQPSNHPSLDHLERAVDTFQLALEKIRPPDNCHTFIYASLGMAHAFWYAGYRTESTALRHRAQATSSAVGLELDQVEKTLLNLLGYSSSRLLPACEALPSLY